MIKKNIEIVYSKNNYFKLKKKYKNNENVIFINIDSEPEIEIDSEIFIKEYLLIISELSERNQSDFWMASNMASKNRFTSKFNVIFKQIYYFSKIISRSDKKIFLLCSNLFIFIIIKKYLKSNISFYIRIIYIINIVLKFMLSKYFLVKEFLYIIKRVITNKIIYKNDNFNKIPHKINYLIKSFTYDSSFGKEGKYSDPFFGYLPEYLGKNGSVLTITNTFGNYKENIKRMKELNDYNIIPIDYFLTFKDLFISFIKILFGKIQFKEDIVFHEINIKNIVNLELATTSMGVSLYQYAHYYAFKRVLEKYSISTYIYTYENNPWERMAIKAFNDNEIIGKANIIGYQHNVIPQSSMNMFTTKVDEKNLPIPDLVVTVGDEPKQILEYYSIASTIPKKIGCGLRFKYLEKIDDIKRSKSNLILVALDGTENVAKLVRYIVKEAVSLPNYKFVLRFHPSYTFENMKKVLPVREEWSPNIEISVATQLLDDLKKSSICIYWGSTVSLEALTLGRPIIHFSFQLALSYDPLFRNDKLKWNVNENIPLKPVIEEIIHMNEEIYHKQYLSARKYLEFYINHITDEKLKVFL